MLKNGLVRLFSPSRLSFSYLARLPALELSSLLYPSCSSSHFLGFPSKPTSVFSSSATIRFLRTSPSQSIEDSKHDPFPGEENEEGHIGDGWKEGEITDEWEEEDVTEPKVGDGGDGGGVVLLDVPWGERAFSIALEVLSQFGDDMKLFAFKTTPRGYVYVRLDKLSNQYGCPSMEELEGYSQEYKKRLDEVGESGQIPNDLALEVSSPGAERLLKVPDDLDRFKDMPMQVCYVGEEESNCSEKNGVFLLESLETDACIWKLADVKENRDPLSKGRPLSRKQKDWRLKLPFSVHKKVSLYIEY
ncbi:Ribosome maturation factor RimP [Trema orientale]|uniref:Ribosome maturation factor RimP n=1 Tax=Trema orientale TaxID=63057 RepID=A0A2P5FHF0_TREOI|nr:Ribosome maturation factor RimP [Trema orientale]